MKHLRISILILLAVTLLSGCGLISNHLKYRDTTKEFVNDILWRKYDDAVKLFALEHPSFKGTTSEMLKSKLPAFHDLIINNFGDHPELTMMSSEKKWSTDENDKDKTPPHTTEILMQISNDSFFSAIKVLFDDDSKKILFIRLLDNKKPIPDMTTFWLMGIPALLVVAFNIYMIIRVKRSQYKTKWPKYLAVILLNVPSLSYKPLGGFVLGFLSFQFLFGISFGYMGYLNSSWEVGIPIGGLYILWRLYKGKDKPAPEPPGEPVITEGETSTIANRETTK